MPGRGVATTARLAHAMFTGIVEQLGEVRGIQRRGVSSRLTVGCAFRELMLGESVAVSGVCLTVDRAHDGAFEADASAETLARSTLGSLRVGQEVNLERALRPDSRLGGHFVGGHVDARVRLVSRASLGEAHALRFSLPRPLARFVAPKGSVALDGVSLTVNEVHDPAQGDGAFDVVVIPHTLRNTTLARLAVGGELNLEVDVLARYVARRLEAPADPRSPTEAHPDAGRNDDSLLRALRSGGWTPS